MMNNKITALYERIARYGDDNIRKQMNNLIVFGERIGLDNFRHYVDNGYSGFDENRPGLTALNKDIEEGKIGTVIARDISRISRDTKYAMAFKRKLEEAGVCLILGNEWIKTHSNPLPKHTHDESNGLDYTLHGDYYFPELLESDQENRCDIGKWGMMHEAFLKENKCGFYSYLLLSGMLPKLLSDLDIQARERWNIIFSDMCKNEGVNEALKARDQMDWIRRTQNIIACCDEIIKAELIFC